MKNNLRFFVLLVLAVPTIAQATQSQRQKFDFKQVVSIKISCYGDGENLPSKEIKKKHHVRIVASVVRSKNRIRQRDLFTYPDIFIEFFDRNGNKVKMIRTEQKGQLLFNNSDKYCFYISPKVQKLIDKYKPKHCPFS